MYLYDHGYDKTATTPTMLCMVPGAAASAAFAGSGCGVAVTFARRPRRSDLASSETGCRNSSSFVRSFSYASRVFLQCKCVREKERER